MESRKVSDNVYYPFIDSVFSGFVDTLKALKDIFIIIQGDPDNTGLPAAGPFVGMTVSSDQGLFRRLSFVAQKGTESWEFDIDITNNQGIVEASTTHPTVHAVVIADSDALATASSGSTGTPEYIEPGRTLWYNEQVNKVTVANIRRINGIEDPLEERDLAVFEPVGGNPLLLEFGPGHNTEWFYDDDGSVTLNVAEGAGKGRNDDLGDTVPGGDPLPDVENVIYNINGLNPVAGDIHITTSDSLALETSRGSITVVKRS